MEVVNGGRGVDGGRLMGKGVNGGVSIRMKDI